jgi:BolA protein
MIKKQIESILAEQFTPKHLEVHDDSHKHEGHAGHRPGGESHFRIVINSEKLDALPRLDRHRAINNALEEIHKKIHALEIHFVK